MSRLRVGVLFGGISSEHQVSRQSAAGVIKALDTRRYEVQPFLIGPTGHWSTDPEHLGRHDTGPGDNLPGGADIGDAGTEGSGPPLPVRPTVNGLVINLLNACDVVLPVLHGRGGEDGTVQGMLDVLAIPYVGSGVAASALAIDKILTKTVLAAAGLPVCPSITVRAGGGAPEDLTDQVAALGLPLFVKPAGGGSSIGVSRVARADELTAAIAHARRYDDVVMIEPALAGPEVDIAVLQQPDGSLITGPALEICPQPGGYFSHAAKYGAVQPPFRIPAAVPAGVATELAALAVQAFRALGCRGLARVDFLQAGTHPVVNEVNTMPGLTAHSQFPRIWEAAGVSYPRLLDILIEAALTDGAAARPVAAQGHCAACLTTR